MADNLFICKECNKHFSRFCWLTRHINKEHCDYKSYFLKHEEPFFHKCPFCEKEKKWVNTHFNNTCGDEQCYSKFKINQSKNIDWKKVTTKARKTYVSRTGYSSPAHNPEVAEKKKQTCREKYGTEFTFQAEAVKQKIKEVNIERYGCEYANSSNEIKEKKKQTFQKRYGVNSFSQLPDWKDKTIKANREKYGTDWAPQSSKFMRAVSHKVDSKYGMSFDSKPELIFYEYCVENGIKVKYHPMPIPYKDKNGKTHCYQPDFEINKQLYEIKGDHLWKGGHLYIPFKRTSSKDFSNDERIMITECKDGCMKENNVIVILQSEIYDGSFVQKLVKTK